MFKPTAKYQELIDAYGTMAREGYRRRSGTEVPGEKVYSDQEALKFRRELKPLFETHSIQSVLDYGAGGGDWRDKTVPEGGTLAEYLGVAEYRAFEPARDRDDRAPVEAVVCFDVLEHIFLGDVGFVLADLYAQASKLVVINVALYPAAAMLPNGENAHITVRPAQWWKGAVDVVASAWPQITTVLFCSEAYNRASRFEPMRFQDVNSAPGFVR